MVTKYASSLDTNTHDLFEASMRWIESKWDSAFELLWETEHSKLLPPHHAIRESVWYAFGLLMRHEPQDIARAGRVLERVLVYQYDDPERIYHATFARAPEEPAPPGNAVIWRDLVYYAPEPK